MTEGIVFQVETARILKILTSEIYDSPLAMLRENVQNAYDAVRMRFARLGPLSEGGRIEISIDGNEISITDNGIGMTEEVLSENFWKAGSSGKNSDDARRAGVVGTFGIGALANFGVCNRLMVETRHEDSEKTLRSVAELDSLKIAEKCISRDYIDSGREIGTTVTAVLNNEHPIRPEQAIQYMKPYIELLPVPVYLNGKLISGCKLESVLQISGRQFRLIGSRELKDNICGGTFDISVDTNGQIMVSVRDITVGGNTIEGSLNLVQSGGRLMGFRSYFGLAPIPAIGAYRFGGIANLPFLQPTAGREALNRESIDQVNGLIGLSERAASELIATVSEADKNNAFLEWLVSHNRYDLANKISLKVLPEGKDVPLGDVKSYIGARTVHYYTGTDQHILKTFAGEDASLLQIAQSNPRRNLQHYYVTAILCIQQVPDSAQVTHMYESKELSYKEASILLRIASILRDDYLVPDVEAIFGDISHGVTVLPKKVAEQLKIYIARSSALLPPLTALYDNAYELFTQFMKDFVRVHIYPRIQEYVLSSTREGVDALRRLLMRNRELYRYEETEKGDLESILGDFLSGSVSFAEVLKTSRSRARVQSQSVSHEQIGDIENEVPGVVNSPVVQPAEAGIEFEPRPPIVREELSSDMKILTTRERYPQLNNFIMLLGLSDRLMRTEADFFRTPHTTRILWGGHRVIYIFTEATGRLSLYYDIELRDQMERTMAGGDIFPTTTLITKKRIFVPVPDALSDEFKITSGAKEFFVRFDVLSSDIT